MLTRLAPTPSGFLHAGNMYNFLLNWLWARSRGGRVLLRIDDGDAARKRPEYLDDIFRVLEWLGLDWDIGPSGPDDFERQWSQARSEDLYKDVLKELEVKNLVFACTCSRKQLDTAPCACAIKSIPLSMPGAAWRMKTEGDTLISFTDKALGAVSMDIAVAAGPFIVRRKDGLPAYQICSLADDRHFGVTHICRGRDLLPSTAMQLYINRQLERPYLNGCRFWHHALLHSAGGDKLSKSAGAMGRSIMLSVKKQDLLHSFSKWMGWEDNLTLNEMVQKME
jgi:glutamyl/glutaminyl-tRNA synthetase